MLECSLPDGVPAREILEATLELGLPGLGPARPRRGDWRARLDQLSDADLLGGSSIGNEAAATCVRSGLLLFADDLDASHRLSQSVNTVDGSYWHGIMHRREPDYSNSKYWFRRVGPNHPAFAELRDALELTPTIQAELGQSWDSFSFVDLVEACELGRRPELREALTKLQTAEMLTLLSHCYRAAVIS